MKKNEQKTKIATIATVFLLAALSVVIYSNNIRSKVNAVFAYFEARKEQKFLREMSACQGIASVNTSQRVVALTFDDGPSGKVTEEILSILKNNNAHATFFINGKNVKNKNDENIVKHAFADGNVIGNHTQNHASLLQLSDSRVESEIAKTGDVINKLTGENAKLFRPPNGRCTPDSTKVVNKLGYKTILWNVITNDWNNSVPPKEVSAYLIKRARPGAIVVMHDGNNNDRCVSALSTIITALKQAGYTFVTIPELLKIGNPVVFSVKN